jgi:hypothetical protein
MRRVFRGLALPVMVTVGFIAVFALVGGIISLGGRWSASAFQRLCVTAYRQKPREARKQQPPY